MIANLLENAPVRVQIVEELVNKKQSLDKTAAGKVVDKGLNALQEQMQQEVDQVRRQLEEDTARTIREHIAQLDNERAKEKLERENAEKRLDAERAQEKRDREKAEERLDAVRAREKREREYAEKKIEAERVKEKKERAKVEKKLEKMAQLLEKSRQEKKNLRTEFWGTFRNAPSKAISLDNPIWSGLMGKLVLLSWLLESFFVLDGLIQSFEAGNVTTRSYSVLYAVYWSLMSYIVYETGQTVLGVFLIICHAMSRLLFEALRQGFMHGVEEGVRSAERNVKRITN